ncbi:MAG TPA: thioredoxin domain-containing protein, partial [Gemmatimonadaceae bacterium]
MANRLAQETSPYLLQHADNPVDWYPWGEEALGRARAEDKPILLSIGYAACHWCHVMAHESFEDAETARLMNERFVNVKVDREERPDLDSVYMQAVQAMTGQGGWPMTVFLTPAGEPFYGGTYFPPEDRHGMPSFRRILLSIADAWQTKRGDIANSAAAIREMYQAAGPRTKDRGPKTENQPHVTADTLARATKDLYARFEPMMGGFGGAPKFPHTMALDFLLRRWARTGDAHALHIATHSFQQMARGGIYDQAGGGFHRFAVDARWLVPHFEKMLYDNALLLRLGAHLYEATKNDEIRAATEKAGDWLAREMTSPEGGFYSSLDADSEGEEGKFYVWSSGELDSLLGADAPLVKAYYGATAGGNFEGSNILNIPADPSEIAQRFHIDIATQSAAIARANQTLMQRRSQRVRPGCDDKILAAWNGLALRGIVEA